MKRILFISFLCAISFISYAQPDACTTPFNLTPQTTCGATANHSLQTQQQRAVQQMLQEQPMMFGIHLQHLPALPVLLLHYQTLASMFKPMHT